MPVAQDPKNTEIARARIAGQLPIDASLHFGIWISGREIPNMRGSRKWSTHMITVAHGAVTARNAATLKKPSVIL